MHIIMLFHAVMRLFFLLGLLFLGLFFHILLFFKGFALPALFLGLANTDFLRASAYTIRRIADNRIDQGPTIACN